VKKGDKKSEFTVDTAGMFDDRCAMFVGGIARPTARKHKNAGRSFWEEKADLRHAHSVLRQTNLFVVSAMGSAHPRSRYGTNEFERHSLSRECVNKPDTPRLSGQRTSAQPEFPSGGPNRDQNQ
jgi:hypothetical protein